MQKPVSTEETGLESNPNRTKYQKFETAEISRSQIKGAPYNPRQISDDAKDRLKDGIARLGLVQPIVWNQRTGNIVGGHQRLSQIDALEARKDYSLTVAVVDVDEARERELNVLLNNPQVCGDWDLPKLEELLDFEGLALENTGFDNADIMRLFGIAPSQESGSAAGQVSDELKAVKDAYEKLNQASMNKDDTDFYLVVVFGSYAHRTEFVKRIGIVDNRYVDGRTLLRLFERNGLIEPGNEEPKGTLAGSEGQGADVGQDKAITPDKPL